MFVTLVVQVGHLDRDYGTDIVRDGVHVNHFGDVEVRAVAVLLNGRLIGKRHLATQHYKRSSNQHFKQFHFFSVPTMQTIYVFSRIGYGRRLYEARVGGLLGPYGFALRRFVWKLGLVYAYGDFDKSQRLESIVVEKVIIHSGAWQPPQPIHSVSAPVDDANLRLFSAVRKHGVGGSTNLKTERLSIK